MSIPASRVGGTSSPFLRSASLLVGGVLSIVIWHAVSVAADETEPNQPKVNPYLARADLTTEQLARFLERMQQRPASVRGRPGFAAAVVDAADRVLTAEPTDDDRVVAVLAKFHALHFMSVRDDQAADGPLATLAERYENDPREAIAAEARFCQLERRAMNATELKPQQLPALLDELKIFFAAQTSLGERHLRIASATVKIINALEDGEAADLAYQEFGTLLAASDEPDLARYGKRIAQGVKPSSLVGKPIEIEGVMFNGTPLDWTAYRGKVVLIDFWATWCGPCRAELPNVKAAYQRYRAQGFEIVGISLDTDREQLERFVLDEGIDWVNLFGTGEATGWKHPMAQRHGVRAIPATFLVDRQGKVIAENLRGEQLTRKLQELFGPEEERNASRK